MKVTQEQFIAAIAPIAVELRSEGSFMFPSVRIAQALLETGSTLHAWNNLLGMKVGSGQPNRYWKGKYVSRLTWEVYDGATHRDVAANFRAYDSIQDNFCDQDLFLLAARYEPVRQAVQPDQQSRMLQACGYATDPDYAVKIVSIIQRHNLYSFDKEAEEQMATLREQLDVLQNEQRSLQAQILALQTASRLPQIPVWAEAAVRAAVAQGVVDQPEGGSYDFYRLLTILHRKGLL